MSAIGMLVPLAEFDIDLALHFSARPVAVGKVTHEGVGHGLERTGLAALLLKLRADTGLRVGNDLTGLLRVRQQASVPGTAA